MKIDLRLVDDTDDTDESVSCTNCDAVCCRLTVVLMPEDDVPRHLVERNDHGVEVMAHGEDGWCVAVDPLRMCCSIYEQRPTICRKFAMGSEYCRDEREIYRKRYDDAPLPLPHVAATTGAAARATPPTPPGNARTRFHTGRGCN